MRSERARLDKVAWAGSGSRAHTQIANSICRARLALVLIDKAKLNVLFFCSQRCSSFLRRSKFRRCVGFVRRVALVPFAHFADADEAVEAALREVEAAEPLRERRA